MKKMIVAVDFDGCITEGLYGFPLMLQDFAKESILEMKELGCDLILWTCRGESDGSLQEAIDFLEKEGLKDCFSKFNDGSDFSTWGNNRKVLADIYIDDKSAGGWIGWKRVMEHVRKEHAIINRELILNTIKITNLSDKSILEFCHTNPNIGFNSNNAKPAMLACLNYFDRVYLGFKEDEDKIITNFPLNRKELEVVTDKILSQGCFCVYEE